MTIRTILVDDEPLAIQGLELRLQEHEDVEIIDKCSNGREAIRSIKTHKPDLVFLVGNGRDVDEFARQIEYVHSPRLQKSFREMRARRVRTREEFTTPIALRPMPSHTGGHRATVAEI